MQINLKFHMLLLFGENEQKENMVTFKNMETGEQETLLLDKVIEDNYIS